MADFDMNDPIMNRHFEAANIAVEPTSTATESGQTADKTADTTQGAPDAAKAEGATEDKTTTKAVDPGKQADATKTGDSGATDGGTKQGQEAKAAKSSGPKDLTLSDGTVIKGGPERRHYETMVLAKQQAAAAEQGRAQLQAEVQSLKAQLAGNSTALTAIGASNPTEVTSALRLMQDLARSPVETVTKLLAEIKALGHTLPDDIGARVDTLAIQQSLARQRGDEQQRQGPTAEDIQQQAFTETGQFFARYPDAVMHDELLGEIIKRNPNVSLDAAYFQLKQAVINQGFDWSQPLRPQVQARQAAPGTVTAQPAKPMTNGRGAESAAIEPFKLQAQQAGETYDDIIRGAMKDAGIATRQ